MGLQRWTREGAPAASRTNSIRHRAWRIHPRPQRAHGRNQRSLSTPKPWIRPLETRSEGDPKSCVKFFPSAHPPPEAGAGTFEGEATHGHPGTAAQRPHTAWARPTWLVHAAPESSHTRSPSAAAHGFPQRCSSAPHPSHPAAACPPACPTSPAELPQEVQERGRLLRWKGGGLTRRGVVAGVVLEVELVHAATTTPPAISPPGPIEGWTRCEEDGVEHGWSRSWVAGSGRETHPSTRDWVSTWWNDARSAVVFRISANILAAQPGNPGVRHPGVTPPDPPNSGYATAAPSLPIVVLRNFCPASLRIPATQRPQTTPRLPRPFPRSKTGLSTPPLHAPRPHRATKLAIHTRNTILHTIRAQQTARRLSAHGWRAVERAPDIEPLVVENRVG